MSEHLVSVVRKTLPVLPIRKGYTLVYADRFAPNAFFILDSELPAGFAERPLGEITPWNVFEHAAPVGGRQWVHV